MKKIWVSILSLATALLTSGCAIYPYDDYTVSVGGTVRVDGYSCSSCGVRLEIELDWHSGSSCHSCSSLDLELLTPTHNLIPSLDGGRTVTLDNPFPGRYEARVISLSDFREYATVYIRQIHNDWPYLVISESVQDIVIDPWAMSVVLAYVD
jgi:hypothetical protein